ncbi:MAG: hypothetical protein AAGE90_20300, partial [Pseudomonadota bacterium]
MADGLAEPPDAGAAPASAIALAFLARTAIIIIDIDFLGQFSFQSLRRFQRFQLNAENENMTFLGFCHTRDSSILRIPSEFVCQMPARVSPT